MANIGLYIELKDGVFKKSNRELLSLARKSGQNVHAVVFCADLQPYLAELRGIQTVIQVQGADLAYQPDRYARTLADDHRRIQADVFCGIFSAQGKDLFPRLAAKAKASLVNDCLAVDLGTAKPSSRSIRASCWPNTRSKTKGPCSPSGPMSSPWKTPAAELAPKSRRGQLNAGPVRTTSSRS